MQNLNSSSAKGLEKIGDSLSKRFPFIARIQKYRSRLSFLVVSVMVILALVPVVLVATATYFRARSLIQEQTTKQLENLVKSQAPALRQIGTDNINFLNQLTNIVAIRESLFKLLDNPTQSNLQYITYSQLSDYISRNQQIRDEYVNGVLVVNPDGRIVVGSNEDWSGLDVSGENVFQRLQNSVSTYSVYNISIFPEKWVTLTAYPFNDGNANLLATFILVTTPQSLQTQLETFSVSFEQGKAYYVTYNSELIGLSTTTGRDIGLLADNAGHVAQLSRLFKLENQEGSGVFLNSDGVSVIGYAKWMTEINSGFAVEIPESVIFRQVDALVPFTIGLLAIALLFIVIVIFFASRALVNPIVQLTNSARNFANGDWSERSTIHRHDEIGVLATAFNQMVEQISDLYRSLEQKVEERARQLRTASEVGQLATSADNREEIVERAVKLVIDRFGYSYASIFLLDEVGASASLVASYSQSGEMKEQKGFRVSVGSEGLISWVAKNNQPRVHSGPALTEMTSNTLLLASSQAEVAIPISVGNQVLGVFEVQSVNSKSFEPESISVLQTLSNQIANGLQNLRLLEATQVNLEETTLLYRASRQISLTHSEAEMDQVIRESLVQTSYVSGIFTVEEDFISINSITDPRNLTSTATTQGITLPLQKVVTSLRETPFVIIEDLTKPSDFDVILSFFSRRGCRSAVIFAIGDNENISRILVLGSRDSTPLTRPVVQPFANVVEVISTTRQRFKLLGTLQERVSSLQTLNRIGQTISAETDQGAMYKALHAQISESMGADLSFIIATYDDKNEQVEIPYLFEEGHLSSISAAPIGEDLTSYIIRSRKPLMLVKDLDHRLREMGIKRSGKTARSWLGIPLMIGSRPIGAMVVQDLLHEERFTKNDLNLFEMIAPHVAVTIRNNQLFDEMQKALSEYDQERFLLNTWMENTPDQVSFKDRDGKYILVSRSFARELNNSDPSELIGNTDEAIFTTEEAEEIHRIERQVTESGKPSLGNVRKLVNGEEEKWKLSSYIPMFDPQGDHAGLFEINRDITDVKKAEQYASKRAEELQIAAEIARDTSVTLDTAKLLANSINLVRERFDFYHASIFLMDSLDEYAVLRESTGEVGIQMKRHGHRLAVGSKSIVGQSISRKEAFIVNDVSNEPLWYANPLLPETQSELAIPLIVGDKVLGALDVQSKKKDAFIPAEVKILNLLADQLAIAVWNSMLFGQTQENLAQHRLLHQITIAASAARTIEEALDTTVRALYTATGGERIMILLMEQDILRVNTSAGYEGVDFKGYSLAIGEGIPGKAVELKQPIRIKDFASQTELPSFQGDIHSELAVPIFFSDRIIGVLDLVSPQPGAYDETDQEILASLGNTLGAIIANAQLVREVRRQVERQRLLYDVTSRIRRTADIQTILETSVKEIARSTGAKRAHIELNVERTDRHTQEDVAASKKTNGNGHKNGKEDAG